MDHNLFAGSMALTSKILHQLAVYTSVCRASSTPTGAKLIFVIRHMGALEHLSVEKAPAESTNCSVVKPLGPAMSRVPVTHARALLHTKKLV